jgi:outer membrane receptor protein involved in Fe transport
MRSKPFAREMTVNGAVRRTHYSTSGPVTTWKLGADWKPVETVRLRATLSSDIRAPNLAELFQNGGSVFANIFDPVVGSTIQVREVQQGNPKLKPEHARTWTAGFIYSSDRSPVAITFDYYSIDVRDVIGTIPSSVIARRCFAGATELCPAVHFNPDGTVSFIQVQTLNSNKLATAGIDGELRYRVAADRLIRGASGGISIRVLGTYVRKLVFVDASGRVDRVGQLSSNNKVGGVPHVSANADLNYDTPSANIGLQARFIGKGRFSAYLRKGSGSANTINDNSVPAYVYFNVFGTINVPMRSGAKLRLIGVVNNLLDRSPPMLPSGTIGGANETSTNPAFYDVVGRAFKLGAELTF